MSAAAAAVGEPLVQHDESLTVLAGTLPDDVLRARLAAADGDAVAILKLGRTFDKVRAALDETGLLDRARYAERAGTGAQRVAPLAEVDPATVPYMSLALVPGRGRRRGRARRRPGRRAAGHRRRASARRPGVAHPGGRGGRRRRHRPGRLPALPGPRARAGPASTGTPRATRSRPTGPRWRWTWPRPRAAGWR